MSSIFTTCIFTFVTFSALVEPEYYLLIVKRTVKLPWTISLSNVAPTLLG